MIEAITAATTLAALIADLKAPSQPWIDGAGYAYFRKRLSEARRDVEHGLKVTLDHFRTRAEQERALEILQFKLDVLWAMLDAMQLAYGIGETSLKGTSARVLATSRGSSDAGDIQGGVPPCSDIKDRA